MAAMQVKELVEEGIEDIPQADEATFKAIEHKLDHNIYRALTSHPFRLKKPSPVQQAVFEYLPEIAEPYTGKSNVARDLLVKAKTGTGKTIGFLVPAIMNRLHAIKDVENSADSPLNARRLVRDYTRKTVGTLVISPTRELATQIATEAQKLCEHTDLEVRLFTGGASRGHQCRSFMRYRRDIVVATPGRLLDLLSSEPDIAESFKNLNVLVLDEADTLLEMGFREDIERVLTYLPASPKRQTFMFSATLSKAIQQVARSALSPNHQFIEVTPSEDHSPVHAHVPQHATILNGPEEQLPHLMRLIAHDQLSNPGKSKIIVFLQTTKQTQLFSTLLRELKVRTLPAGSRTFVYELHSKKSQAQRDMASDSFRHDTSGASILVTSDVSARGVDYPDVTRVIQVGVPAGRDPYIHRIGRTGRAGKDGRGDFILMPWERNFLRNMLSDVPIKRLSVDDLKNETLILAAQHDSDPKTFFREANLTTTRKQSRGHERDRRVRSTPVTSFHDSVEPSIKATEEEIRSLLEKLDADAIAETHMALLGFYASRVEDLQIPRGEIVAGLNAWTTEGLCLPSPPHVSEQMLARIGLATDPPRPRRGGSSRPSRGSFGLSARTSYDLKRSQSRKEREWDDSRGFKSERHKTRSNWATRNHSRREPFERL